MPPVTVAINALWEKIDERTLSVAAAAITFSGIDTSFTFLRLTGYIVNDANASVFVVRINNDSGANYDMQNVDASAAVVTGTRTTAQNEFAQRLGMAASQESFFTMMISKPVAGEEAQAIYHDSTENAAGIVLNLMGDQWNDVAAQISRLDILKLANNLDAETRILLEGAKPA